MQKDDLNKELDNPYVPVGIDDSSDQKQDGGIRLSWVLGALFSYVVLFAITSNWSSNFLLTGVLAISLLLVVAWLGASLLYSAFYGGQE